MQKTSRRLKIFPIFFIILTLSILFIPFQKVLSIKNAETGSIIYYFPTMEDSRFDLTTIKKGNYLFKEEFEIKNYEIITLNSVMPDEPISHLDNILENTTKKSESFLIFLSENTEQTITIYNIDFNLGKFAMKSNILFISIDNASYFFIFYNFLFSIFS